MQPCQFGVRAAGEEDDEGHRGQQVGCTPAKRRQKPEWRMQGNEIQSRPQFRPHSALSHILFQHHIFDIFFLFFFSFFFSKNALRARASAASCCVYVPHQKDRLFSRPKRLCGFSTFESGGSGGKHLPPHFFFFTSFFCNGYRKRSSNSTPSPSPSPLVHSPNYSSGMKPGLVSAAQCPGVSPRSWRPERRFLTCNHGGSQPSQQSADPVEGRESHFFFLSLFQISGAAVILQFSLSRSEFCECKDFADFFFFFFVHVQQMGSFETLEHLKEERFMWATAFCTLVLLWKGEKRWIQAVHTLIRISSPSQIITFPFTLAFILSFHSDASEFHLQLCFRLFMAKAALQSSSVQHSDVFF